MDRVYRDACGGEVFYLGTVQIGLGREICEEGIDVRDFV